MVTCPNGLTITIQEILTDDKGRGIIAECPFKRGDFLCCYRGEMISKAEGERRKNEYKEDLGSYLFFFKHNGNDLWFVADTNVADA